MIKHKNSSETYDSNAFNRRLSFFNNDIEIDSSSKKKTKVNYCYWISPNFSNEAFQEPVVTYSNTKKADVPKNVLELLILFIERVSLQPRKLYDNFIAAEIAWNASERKKSKLILEIKISHNNAWFASRVFSVHPDANTFKLHGDFKVLDCGNKLLNPIDYDSYFNAESTEIRLNRQGNRKKS